MWVLGSSIVKEAFIAARRRPGGVNLGLSNLNVSIWWQGKSGMVASQIKPHIITMLKYEEPPTFLVIHVAGNDLGNIKVGYLRNQLKSIIRWIKNSMPHTILIWSQILPRTDWRYSSNRAAMSKARYRINNSVADFIVKSGGKYIRYPDIKPNSYFLKQDGVHLTDLGNNIFLNTLQGGLEFFIHYGFCHVFP